MIKLDDNLLTELGLQSLPAEDKKALLRHIYETLEMRVGTTLARQMTDAQLDEFEGFINNNDEAGALRWLETNFPNYKDVVAQEFEVLKAEVRQSAPQIMASAGGATAAMPQQPQQMTPVNPELQPQLAVPASQPIAEPQYQQYQQPVPQQYAAPQPYEAQQQSYNSMPAQQAPQPMPNQQPLQADYQQYQQPQPMAQPQPMQQFEPVAPQPQQYAAPQYPQPIAPSPYQQPAQQPQPQQPQPFDQNQFGQAA